MRPVGVPGAIAEVVVVGGTEFELDLRDTNLRVERSPRDREDAVIPEIACQLRDVGYGVGAGVIVGCTLASERATDFLVVLRGPCLTIEDVLANRVELGFRNDVLDDAVADFSELVKL